MDTVAAAPCSCQSHSLLLACSIPSETQKPILAWPSRAQQQAPPIATALQRQMLRQQWRHQEMQMAWDEAS